MNASWGDSLAYGATQDAGPMYNSQPGYDNSSFASTRLDNRIVADAREPIICMTIDQVYNRFAKCIGASSLCATLELPNGYRPIICILCRVLSFNDHDSTATVYDYIGSGSLNIPSSNLPDRECEWIYVFGDIAASNTAGDSSMGTLIMYPMAVRKAADASMAGSNIPDSVTLHILDCMHSLMWLKHGSLARIEQPKKPQSTSPFSNNILSSPSRPMAQKPSSTVDDIKSFISNRGSATFDDISSQFSNVSSMDIKNAITSLESGGHIYQSENSYHFMEE